MLTTGAFGGYRTVKVLVTSSSLVDNVECWPTQLLRENKKFKRYFSEWKGGP